MISLFQRISLVLFSRRDQEAYSIFCAIEILTNRFLAMRHVFYVFPMKRQIIAEKFINLRTHRKHANATEILRRHFAKLVITGCS